MNYRIKEVLDTFRDLDIPYEINYHEPAYTIEDMDALELFKIGFVCKNLFLRNASGKQHYLVSFHKDKTADIKKIQEKLGSSRLSFGSQERLMKHLGLNKGEVTPLSVSNNEDHKVIVVLDKELEQAEKIGIHPNDNSATVWISYDGLVKYIAYFKNTIITLEI